MGTAFLSHLMAKGKWLTDEQKQCITNGNEHGYNSTAVGNVIGIKADAVRGYLSTKRKN
jgi:hypothetical protein